MEQTEEPFPGMMEWAKDVGERWNARWEAATEEERADYDRRWQEYRSKCKAHHRELMDIYDEEGHSEKYKTLRRKYHAEELAEYPDL